MKMVTVKIDDTLVTKAMKRGGFKKPDEAVSFWLKRVIETPEPLKKIKHHPLVEELTGIIKSDADPKDLLANALAEKHSR